MSILNLLVSVVCNVATNKNHDTGILSAEERREQAQALADIEKQRQNVRTGARLQSGKTKVIDPKDYIHEQLSDGYNGE
jgi:hypothetical protein